MNKIFALVTSIPALLYVQIAIASPNGSSSAPILETGSRICVPFYPLAAFNAGTTGQTDVTYRVGTDGMVKDVAVEQSSGSTELDDAAGSCISARRYAPAEEDRAPVERAVKETITWVKPRWHSCQRYYTRAFKAARLSGTTRIQFVVTTNGSVTAPVVVRSSGSEDLDRAAQRCVKDWMYRPATQTSRPITIEYFADIAWGSRGPPDFTDKVRHCVSSNPPTAQQLAGIAGVTYLSFVLTDNEMASHGYRIGFPCGRGHRHHEYHACFRYRKDQGDRDKDGDRGEDLGH